MGFWSKLFGTKCQPPSKKAITLEQLQQMFSEMKRQTKWDLAKPMLWGYFFTHSEPERLKQAAEKLVSREYRFVKIYKADKKASTDPDVWWLHVEKEEVHSPESLDQRNEQLYVFAHEFGLVSYDGMDVGPIKASTQEE